MKSKKVDINKYQREWYKKNLLERRKKARIYCKKNKEKINEWSKKWRKENPKKCKEYYQKYREKNREKIKQSHREVIQKMKLEVLSHYSGGKPFCNCCGEKEIKFLCIDHINGGGNIHRREINKNHKNTGTGNNHFYYWLKRNNYPKGFQVLCFNCNFAKGHFGKCPHKKEIEIDGVGCPFCGTPIKGKVPEGLNLNKVIKLINRIKLCQKQHNHKL